MEFGVTGSGVPGRHYFELQGGTGKMSAKSKAASSALMANSLDASPGANDPLNMQQSVITMAEMQAASFTGSQDSNPDPLKAPEMLRFLKES